MPPSWPSPAPTVAGGCAAARGEHLLVGRFHRRRAPSPGPRPPPRDRLSAPRAGRPGTRPGRSPPAPAGCGGLVTELRGRHVPQRVTASPVRWHRAPGHARRCRVRDHARLAGLQGLTQGLTPMPSALDRAQAGDRDAHVGVFFPRGQAAATNLGRQQLVHQAGQAGQRGRKQWRSCSMLTCSLSSTVNMKSTQPEGIDAQLGICVELVRGFDGQPRSAMAHRRSSVVVVMEHPVGKKPPAGGARESRTRR